VATLREMSDVFVTNLMFFNISAPINTSSSGTEDFVPKKTGLHVALCERISGAKAVESCSKAQKTRQVF